ncbi:MAG: EAL domain-containing protein [Lachnospiraceae bacterium]
MAKILYFDLCAIVILIILLASLFFRKMVSGRGNKYLALLLADVLITAIFDCWAEAYGTWIPLRKSDLWLRELQYYVYFLVRNITTPLYQLFICAITDTWHILMKNKWLQCLFITPYLVICATLCSNPFFHTVFYFNEDLVYTRGPLIYVLYSASFFYLLCGVVYLFKYRKMLATDKFIALLLMYPLNVFAVLIQLFWPEYLVEMFMTSLSLLLVTIVVQRPEETVNPVLGVRNYTAFSSDMKKACFIHKPVQIIFIKLVNYRGLSALLKYDVCNLLMKKIATGLSAAYNEEHFPMDLYYLEDGLFALVSEKEQNEKLKEVAECFSAMLSEGMQLQQLELELDACICIIRSPKDIDNYEALLSFANSFYMFLPAGGAVNDVAEAEDRRLLQLQNELDSIISRTIAEGGLQMYYQPIYSVKKEKFLSAEALIRLYDKKYGFISPELFIPAAEKSGAIHQIGDFMMDEVCRFLADCEKNGPELDYMEINLSVVQCMRNNLVEKVKFYLDKYKIAPERLNIEMTETAANTAQDIVEENLRQLSKLGIHFSLDDYGTGYSNISRIVTFPFHIAKLDKSMVSEEKDSKMDIALRNTINMLKELGMEIVAEGVETEEVLKKLTKYGCDYIQGYYFSKPLPKTEFVQFIKESAAK